MRKLKSFQFWTQEEVEKRFDLRAKPRIKELDELLSANHVLTDLEKTVLDSLRLKLLEMAAGWSEEDLKMQFIGPVINFADMAHRKYRIFYDCSIKADFHEETIGGKVDGLLAKGFFSPEKPFFFLQEFKREKGKETDPAGQLLAAMVVAQQLNGSVQDSLYGCYITGRSWFFLVLKGKDYAVSNAYNSTEEDLYQIISILRQVKTLFEQKLNYVPD